jgi:hypothetical protein
MNTSCTIEGELSLPGRKGPCTLLSEQGRVPRVARLLALALRFEKLIGQKHVANYSTLARLGHVSRARITQIMNLCLLSPDIQEAILYLPPTRRGRDPIRLARLQPIALTWSWAKQRRMWTALLRSRRDSQDS